MGMARRWLVVVAAPVLAGMVGCADDVRRPVDDATSTSATAGASTTTAPTATTFTSAPPGQPPTAPTDPSAQEAAQRLIDAWTAGDLDAAVAATGSDVANALFAHPAPPAADPQPCRGSETEVGATECDYAYAGGVVTVVVTGNAGNGYRVTNVGVIPT
jgi:hypothetical protein